ncbi:MAG: hypothetical protein HOG03_13685 [Desulfobacula sp.]|jgi:Tfp pilus tip-associated adhesin PilY1|uniref:PilC/PilY family type IV pilus protein n=1 Tax=Desulfobacula sp. TaxID=2593537 RepID=UPI001D82224B|nr:hypothetical protein [Desulfobacula sp.]MBT3486895.1 hypothetical protein [Desulfobacula sp.]MBT3805629.1 hypothetical protein [Desulfobacula sp.]MBT4026501.1 hypothetical protein [Desulfobacula sp.]MBT4199608.1 hypothetical protein [Desulfobacula sp.]
MVFKKKIAGFTGKCKFIMLSLFFLLYYTTNGLCIDISDDPMDTKVQAAPPNIMFVIDNSGSMDWEFMTEENNGRFTISGSAHEYLFSNPGDNVYSSYSSNGTILSNTDKEYWKGQWSGYNKLYYNPSSTYTPWPGTATYTMDDADLKTSYSNPIHVSGGDPSITLKNTFKTITYRTPIIVDNADGGPDFTTTGTWSESSYENEWPYPDATHSSLSTNGSGTAVFKPDIPNTDVYEVYAWWNCYSSRDTNAKITINHIGGPTIIFKTQQASAVTKNEPGVCGEWISLGDYNFNSDDSGNVVIERHGASTGDSTIADAIKFIRTSTPDADILIKNAHYFTWYDENSNETVDNLEVYLVTWEDTDADDILDHRLYYQVDNTDDDKVESLELRPLSYHKDDQGNDEVPNDIQPKNYDENGSDFTYKTDEEDLQNFANWYSYYRRRELAAKAAIAKSILDLDWVYAGFYTINSGLRQTVLPINVESNSIIVDNKDSGFTKSGTWKESSAQNYGQEYNESSLYSSRGTAKWTPSLTAGSYKVYAWWGYAGSRTTQAQYTINHSGGTSTITKNHNIQTEAFQWQLLGTYSFNAGTSGYVTVKNIGSTRKYASADAIKFEGTSGGTTVDDTDTLLNLLYEMNSSGGTPLRAALRDVGRYYDQDDGYTGNLGTSPFKDEADGGACQQAFTVLMTDGYYNGSDPGIGNEDGDDGAPYADSYSDTLADMAIKYYDTDLADTLPDNLPTNNYDNKKSQHMITYSVSFGVTGTIDQTDMDNDGITDNPSYEDDPYFLNSNTPKPTWPNPDSGDSQKIDDLWHAAVNGRGEFFSADDPEELVSSLNSVFENLASRIASGASVSVNGDELNTGSVMYQSTYTSGDWEGDVTAYPIDSHTGEIKTEDSDILWHASEKLQSQDWDTGRKIVTYNGYDDIIIFRYDNLTALQKTSIDSNPDVVDFIRGKEISGFRSRQKKLGDIVHSAPLLVIGDSMDNDSDSDIDEEDEESGLIFTGGNDGMLHAFDAQTGDEMFAYIPHIVFEHLTDLTLVDYDHKFYVDATPFSKTINVNNNELVVLTGGLKKGGKGYFCLDITKILYQNTTFSEDELATPAHTDGIDVLWEYPQLTTAGAIFASDDDLGYSFSDIFIVESYKTDSDPGNHNWVAIFGNGYDSVNGSAILYILNAYTGELIKKIDTGAAGNNGLSSPALIDIDNDGKVDYAYAGDLLGNMWKFDLTSDDSANWKVAYTETDSSPAPLFSSPSQPITSTPDVMNHCADDEGYMVLFGTGKFIAESDRTNNDQQTIYGIWDTGFPVGEWNETLGTLSKMAGATLLEQTEINFQYLNDHYLRTLSDNEATWVEVNEASGLIESGTHIGWYFDLPMDMDNDLVLDGERVIKNVMIRDGHLIAIAFTPNDSPCTGGGTSMVHELDACDGSRLSSPQFDINEDGIIDISDMIEIDDPDNPGQMILVPPTGKGYDGLLHPPIIVTMPNKTVEMKIFSSSAGTTERLFENAEGGFYYWREIKN